MFNRNKSNNNQQQQNNNSNSNNQEAPRHLDRNNDGIPDYLQKETIPSLIKDNKDLNQFELDVIQEIESFIRALQGYEYDPTASVWVHEHEQIMSDLGIRKIKRHMEALVNKHSMTTEIKIEELHELIQRHNEELIKWFTRKFNVLKCDITDLSPIIDELDVRSFIILSKSIKGGGRDAITARTKLTGTTGGGSFP